MKRLAYWVKHAEPFFPQTCLTDGTFLPSLLTEEEQSALDANPGPLKEFLTFQQRYVLIISRDARAEQCVSIRPFAIETKPTMYLVEPCPEEKTPYLITDDQSLFLVYEGTIRFEEKPDLTFAVNRLFLNTFSVSGFGWVGVLQRKCSRFIKKVTWHLTAYAFLDEFQLIGEVFYSLATPPLGKVVSIESRNLRPRES